MSTSTRTSRSASGMSGGRKGGSNRLVLILVGVAVIAFVGVVAVLSAGEGADLPGLSDVAAPVTVDGDPISVPYPEDGPDPAVGLPSPVITALDYDDQEVTIGAPGQAQVLVFLAHWCPVCEQELPTLRALVNADGVPDDVELVLVTTGLDPGRPNWPPRTWLRDAGLGDVLTVRDDSGDPMMRAFGLRAYPAWAVIGADGTIVARRQGLLPAVGVAQLVDLASR
jgi:cytochrome c biogenesis protein CcmG, thiol:disulfide interchange protein DsbE